MLTATAWAAAVVALWAAGDYAVPHALKRAAIERLRTFTRSQRLLALTYDDGPGPETTPLVRAALAQAGARATFFPTAVSAGRAAALLDVLAADGHEIGCHSATHRHAWHSPPWVAPRDMSQGFAALRKWVSASTLFRPPYGKTTGVTWLAAAACQRPLAWWTVDSGDTHATLPAPAAIAGQITADGGGVLLLHDFDRQGTDRAARRNFVVDVTRAALAVARRDGLTVAPLGEVLRRMRTR